MSRIVKLPAGYRQVDYIQSTGTQYVDTGFKPNNNTRVVMRAELTDYSTNTYGNSFFGARSSSNTNAFLLICGTSANATWTVMCGGSSANATLPALGVHEIDFNKNICTVDGTPINTAASKFSSEITCYLFTDNRGGSANTGNNARAKLYSCKIYDNGVLARDYYPATADGAAGLWDACSGILYTSASGTALLAGPEIKYTPDTPSDFTAAEITDKHITLAWSAVEDAAGYRVYRNGLLRADTTETSYTDALTPFESTEFSVTAYSDLGESEPAVLAVNYFPENPVPYLITDRTAADVTRAQQLNAKWIGGVFTGTTEELAEWFGNLRGAYNASDLNRVGAAVRYLAERFAQYGYQVSVNPKTDWTADDIPTPTEMDEYLGEVAKVRALLDIATAPPLPEDAEGLTYAEANAIEIALVMIDETINSVVQGFARSASFMFVSGNRPIPTAQSNLGRTWAQLDAMGTTWENWQLATWYLLLYGNLKAQGVIE